MKLEKLKEKAEEKGLEYISSASDEKNILYDYDYAFFKKGDLRVAYDKDGKAYSRLEMEGMVMIVTAYQSVETPYLAVNPYYRNPQLDARD